MSATNCRAGLLTVLATVDGLQVLAAEPRSLQHTPASIVALIGGTVNYAGQVKSRTWRFAVRLCVAMQDVVVAEEQLALWVDSVCAAVLANLTLDGKATVVPILEISGEGDDGFYTLNGVDYRSIVIRFDIRDKKD